MPVLTIRGCFSYFVLGERVSLVRVFCGPPLVQPSLCLPGSDTAIDYGLAWSHYCPQGAELQTSLPGQFIGFLIALDARVAFHPLEGNFCTTN